MAIDSEVLRRANAWLNGNYDQETKDQIENLMENDPDALTDAFYRDLEFGTGGMRGKMGPGTNRMNVYVVSMATQGLCNYLKKSFPGEDIAIAIAYDCRNNNTLFAQTTARVCSANGIKVYLFESLRPTPELSFAVRYLKCKSGVVITASHNPKEYNGYKVYWDDGAQLVPPHDKNVIAEVQKIESIDEVKQDENPALIKSIGKEIDEAFLAEVKKQALQPDLSNKNEVKIVYTPLHGTGGVLLPRALKENGYTNLHFVEEQMITDGNFPTAASPNPEEPKALTLALKKARELEADIVMATDPDADRIGLAVRDKSGEYILLNGNQTGAVIVNYILQHWKDNQLFKGNEITVKTIVTSELLKDISEYYGVKQYDTLTGFKWIADMIRQHEKEEHFIVGLEESFGYMIGDFVRDKDSVTSALIIAEIAASAKLAGKSILDKLIDIYLEFGFYKEGLVNIYREGKSGAEEIAAMMDDFRANPPKQLGGSRVAVIKDYKSLEQKNIQNGSVEKIVIPASNVLQFITEDGTKISVRPSGTEPKIKFYFSVKEQLEAAKDYARVEQRIEQKIDAIKKDLGL